MSSTTHHDDRPVAAPGEGPRRDLAQLGLAAVTAVVGAYTIYDASTLQVGFADPVGPRIFPYAIGAGLLITSVLLVLAALRGDVPEAEGGEDVDLDVRADWVTVAKLVGIIGVTIATVGFLGWAISGAILFAGSTWALGSRTLVRDVLVGCVLSVASWYAFYVGLGIPLSAGILDGIL
jgi:putative tricarboxylic transport membrane protein